MKRLVRMLKGHGIGLSLVILMGGGVASFQSYSADSRSPFEQLELFNKVLNLLQTQYYREVDTGKLIQGAIKGMLDTLDPHTAYLPEEMFNKMQNDTAGEFGGLGLEVSEKDGVLIVITPIEDSPAFEAGIKPKDRIVEIDHESTLGMSLEDAVKKMRGQTNSKIYLGISREGEENIRYFELTRKIIKISAVKSELLQNDMAYIRLVQFQKDVGKSIEKALIELKAKAKKPLSGIILDMRSNPGGLLDEAVSVSSAFLKEGIVVSTEARDPKTKEIRYVSSEGSKDITTPMAVLINGATASASEIVAGALQDHGRAVIMGGQSFGKGSVQTVLKIDDKNGLKLTIAQYMTPKNRRIQALGITPDIVLPEYEGAKLAEASNEDLYVREKDLRGHLTAAIETEEEKAQREEIERKELIERRKRMAEKNQSQSLVKNKKEKAEAEIPTKKASAQEDFQVIQAMNILRYQKFLSAPGAGTK